MSSHTLRLLESCYCSCPCLYLCTLPHVYIQRFAENSSYFSFTFRRRRCLFYFLPSIYWTVLVFTSWTTIRPEIPFKLIRNSFGTTILRVSYSHSLVFFFFHLLPSQSVGFFLHTWCNRFYLLSSTHMQMSWALTQILLDFLVFFDHLFHFILILAMLYPSLSPPYISQLKAHLSEDTTRVSIYSRCVSECVCILWCE